MTVMLDDGPDTVLMVTSMRKEPGMIRTDMRERRRIVP